MAQEAQSKEERERAWWDAWRAADYSWDGLAQKEWAGWSVIVATGEVVESSSPREGDVRPATLQDYWRLDLASGRLRDDAAMAGELIAAQGQPTYHMAHCPLAYADGTPTAKAGWGEAERAALHALFGARLGAAAETAFEGPWYNRKPVGADRRAQLDGCVLLRAPAHPQGKTSPLNLRARQSAWAGDIDFGGAPFGGGVDFNSAIVSGDARFNSATFSGDASFNSAIVSGGASFRGATFSGYASFDSATFSGYPIFESATFSGDAGFDSATFSGDADFTSSRFGARAVFDDARFLTEAGRVNFRTAVFAGTAHFWRTRFPEKLACISKAFTAARFEDVVDFTGSGTHWVSALADVVFKSGVLVDDPPEGRANHEFKHVIIPATRAAAKTYLDQKIDEEKEARGQGGERIKGKEKRAWRHEREDWRLNELEAGCRALKNAMGAQRNEKLEQRYYKFQLIAEREQRRTSRWVKVFSGLYAAFSDYGASMARPLGALMAMIVAFAGVFWAWARALAGGFATPGWAFDPGFLEALRYSLSRVLPFGAFGAERKDWPWLDRFLSDAGAWSLAVRAVASLESLFAIVLAFLFALAVRRRFQIS